MERYFLCRGMALATIGDTMNRTEIATNWTLWQEYVDPSATMTHEEFDAMSVEQKIQIQVDCFGPEDTEVE